MREITLSELASMIDGELEGDGSAVVTGAAPIDQAGINDVAFLANPKYERYVSTAQAAGVIVSRQYVGSSRAALIRCADPYFAFRQAMVALYGFRKSPFIGIHRYAYVDQRARLGQDVAVGPYAVICQGAEIGDRTVLYPGVFVGPRVKIGPDCVLYPGVTIYEDCTLGQRVTVHANSVIGQDGFGYATHQGVHHKIPQVGWVEVGDDVEVGAGCTIDRAAIGATRIGAGTKFSNLVAIGHGTQVGRHNLLVAQVGIAGSVTVGDYCVFAGQAGVVGHLTIGDFVRIGAQAGVTADVPAKSEMLGSPAVPLAKERRNLVLHKQLPEMRETIRRLERQVADLTEQLQRLAGSAGGNPGDGKTTQR